MEKEDLNIVCPNCPKIAQKLPKNTTILNQYQKQKKFKFNINSLILIKYKMNFKIKLTTAMIVLLLLAQFTAAEDWQMFGHDLEHTGETSDVIENPENL